MRNLRNTHHVSIKFGDETAQLTATAWDGDDLICCFGPSISSPVITLKKFSQGAYAPDQAVSIASWDSPPPDPNLAVDRILDVHYLSDSGAVCLILEGGDIVLVRENPQPEEDLIEIVGSVDAGITAAAWSSDGELLAIATKADTILYMTRDFEGTANITLSEDDLKVSNHVSVGWGKAETQFKGRGAKAMRDPTMPEHVDEGRLSEFDDCRVTISWRGDGQFLAVNSILLTPKKRRVIRVYSREGVLESVSEPIDGLEGTLSWKPSGQLIAGIQRTSEKVEVIFFERNGLRHGEFSLRLAQDELNFIGKSISLAWNSDSSVLAVTMADRVQLWTMGNYHYYLKQEVPIQASLQAPLVSSWHPERALQLVSHSSSELRILKYAPHIASGPVAPPYDQGIVAVIDGQTMKVTPFRTANVPPPMAFDEFDLPAHALDVAIDYTGQRMAVLHHDSISEWTCDYSARPAQKANLIRTLDLSSRFPSESYILRQVAFVGSNDVMTVASTSNTLGSTCLRLSEAGEDIKRSNERINLLFQSTTQDQTSYQDDQGAIHDVETANSPSQLLTLPAACSTVRFWQHESFAIVFGLSNNGVLHIKTSTQMLKILGCTSFEVTSSHLIYTTSQHLLKFVHLNSATELEIPADEPEKDERCRSVERGAKLVTVMPSSYSLVLQMPRGNLETIFPRALVLAGIRQAIIERCYKKAFLICRTHRVDMNILHDYRPDVFCRDVELFIKQVKKAEYIDLFLSSLSDEDVSETIYKDTFAGVGQKPRLNGNVQSGDTDKQLKSAYKSKVNKICDLFLGILNSQTPKNLQSIITCHVCKSPPDLEAGLALISQLRSSNKGDKQEQEGEGNQLDRAIEHICFLADINQLYDSALGLYDLDVALLVAQQSQKDPREYLPYLQKLHEMSTLRRRFAIDNDLKRYRKALTHLHSIGDFEELKTFVAKHDLYTAAIELHRYDNTRLTDLMRLYANFLSGRNRYNEAGIAYEYIGDYASAYESYRGANMWRECLSSAALAGIPNEKISDLAQDIANGLVEAKDFVSAATVHLEYLNDLETASRLLCKGYRFAEAMRLIALRWQDNAHLLKSVVDAGLIEGSASMTEMLAEMKAQLQAQIPRLRELRQKKVDDPMAFLDGGEGGNDDGDVPDNISLAPTDASTSGGTFMTRYTNRSTGTLATNATRKTSKNRRREERKRARGKKGTIYEEEYLVNSIARLIERMNAIGEDVERLVEGLMRRTMRERALAVEAGYRDVVSACKECLGEVFGSGQGGVDGDASSSSRLPQLNGATHMLPSGSDAAEEVTRRVGGQGVLFDALEASSRTRQVPILKEFARLALLD